ncbi:MAG: transcription antitermination factor NusB [Polyangiaceae bacterium]
MSAGDARGAAARVLLRVARDAAYLSRALDAELERQAVSDVRERALATELAYGVTRTRAALLGALGPFVPRGVEKTDERVLVQLLLAAYQLLFLDRVPAFAAVDAAVRNVRAERGPKPAGFANAVLRKLASAELRVSKSEAIVSSVPVWLRERLTRDVGEAEMRALVGATDGEPPLTLRARLAVPLPPSLDALPRGRVSPLARVLGPGDPRKLAGYSEGAFVVQEEGAQVVALALGVRPGQRVLDACAGRGQKTSLFSEQLGSGAELWACDVHPAKLAELAREHRRLGLAPPHTLAVDLGVGAGNLPEGFQRILVDAPCTGSGTLRRRPELALRLGPDDPARLADLQRRILETAARRAAPGARIVYAVCSVLREEGEEVVSSLGDLLEPVPFDAPELVEVLGRDTTRVRLLPLAHGTDGFFMASLRRR